MSRWLKSVNTLLDNLDGTVADQAAGDGQQLLETSCQVVSSTTAGLIGGIGGISSGVAATRRLNNSNHRREQEEQDHEEDDDDDDDDDDDEYSTDEYYTTDDNDDGISGDSDEGEEDNDNNEDDPNDDDNDVDAVIPSPVVPEMQQPLSLTVTNPITTTTTTAAETASAVSTVDPAPDAAITPSAAAAAAVAATGGQIPIGETRNHTTDSVSELSFSDETQEIIGVVEGPVVDVSDARTKNDTIRPPKHPTNNPIQHQPPLASFTNNDRPTSQSRTVKNQPTTTTTTTTNVPTTAGTKRNDSTTNTTTTTTTSNLSPSPASNNNNNSNNSKVKALQSLLDQARKDLATAQNKNQRLEQRMSMLEETIARNEQEMQAQARELQQAGKELESIRTTAQEEQDDILEEHEEEMEELQKQHQSELDQLRDNYEKTIAEWKESFQQEQQKRQQEGGNWNQELEDAIQRERDALTKLSHVTIENDNLRRSLEESRGVESELQQKLKDALHAAKTALEREKQAQDELDASKARHSKQLAQRQRRESELEQTISELGSALSLAKQHEQLQQQQHFMAGNGVEESETVDTMTYKVQWEQAVDEIESLRVQLAMEQQRRESLHEELQDVSAERTREAEMEQARQQDHDRKIAELELTISQLQASLHETAGYRSSNNDAPLKVSSIMDDKAQTTSSVQQEDLNHHQQQQQQYNQRIQQQLNDAKGEISNLSEQVLKYQQQAEYSKSEILTLKGRLQAATSRAEKAEEALSQSRLSSFDVEVGGAAANSHVGSMGSPVIGQSYITRRRIKGRAQGSQVRTIRSALRLGPAVSTLNGSRRGDGSHGSTSTAMDQLFMTIDAVDQWMVDTGTFLRHEPLARLFFFLYLTTLHLWSFALIVFHTTEVEHGDFGSMDSNPRHWRERS
ncbi:hypothetical protein IV203_036938 [Nitzschia inconspicua]|uniref:Golgin-84 n=1 Tax=Nitzschia inconspicua TaxID=303405 RepID=A0A9K3LGS9_9STRA|nr:hypothetical protein IV203_036938 [Nitzschia inconspicua]